MDPFIPGWESYCPYSRTKAPLLMSKLTASSSHHTGEGRNVLVESAMMAMRVGLRPPMLAG